MPRRPTALVSTALGLMLALPAANSKDTPRDALWAAVRDGDARAVRAALDPGADVDPCDGIWYQTPLSMSAGGLGGLGNADLVRRFPKAGTKDVAAAARGNVALLQLFLDTGKLARSGPAEVKEVYAVDWTPRGDVLVTAGRAGEVVLWDPRELRPLRELDSPEWVIQDRFGPDGTRRWTAGGGTATPAGRTVVIWGLPDR